MTGVPAQSVRRGRRAWLNVGLGLTVAAVAGVAAVSVGADAGSRPVDPITRFLLAAAVILVVCQLFGLLMHRVGQPPVLGEIIGGLLLGPSALGAAWPEATAWLFPPEVVANLNTAAQLGLVVFMFLLGCGLRTDRIESSSMVTATVALGMGLPLLVGAGIALGTGTVLAGPDATRTSHALFLGVAMSITALPVLARILVDLDILHTRVGALALSSAAIGDAVAWLALTVVLASAGTGGGATATALLAVALIGATWLGLRPALGWLVATIRSEQALMVVLLAGAIGYAALTQALHLHPLIGAFLFGVAVPRDTAVVERIREQLVGFTLMVLLPLFFAGIGLVTSVGLIGGDGGHVLLFLGVLLAAMLAKFVGVGAAARLTGLSGRETVQLGVLMNCRGVTELVVATVGLQYGFINELGFTMLVLVAVITTAMTVPVLRLLRRNSARRGTTTSDVTVTEKSTEKRIVP